MECLPTQGCKIKIQTQNIRVIHCQTRKCNAVSHPQPPLHHPYEITLLVHNMKIIFRDTARDRVMKQPDSSNIDVNADSIQHKNNYYYKII